VRAIVLVGPAKEIPAARTAVGTSYGFLDHFQLRSKAISDFATRHTNRTVCGFRFGGISIKGVKMIITAWSEVGDDTGSVVLAYGEG
jgi:hypothetical protein